MGNKNIIWCPDCKDEHLFLECPLKGLCLSCKERPATISFGDALSFTHGGGTLNRCALCAAEEQLAYARERAEAIPELEAKVKEARAALDGQAPTDETITKEKMALNRLAHELRVLADEIWDKGLKDLTDDLHAVARKIKERADGL